MRIVLALGGNAISRDSERGDIPDQIRNVRISAEHIADLVEAEHQVVVTHGNGPQVGNVLLRAETARKYIYPLPLDICGAHTQGGIGYLLQREIANVFRERGLKKMAVSMVTQSLVDEHDSSFFYPTKPIGPFFRREQIQPLIEKEGWKAIEVADKGWRRIVASPRPIRIIEEEFISKAIEMGAVVVCCGGGGIPVVEKGGRLFGVEAVIDKDFASGLLAVAIQADVFMISTNVERVAICFGKPDQKFLDELTVSEARKYMANGEFSPGTMGPKILAAIEFVEARGKEAIISLPEKTTDAIEGRTGTRIVKG